MSKRSGASALVDRAVLEAARAVFAERGFHEASVDDVAAAAGLTKGAAYSRYASKEALFVAAALHHEGEFVDTVVGITPASWARSWARRLRDERRWNALALEFRLYASRHPTVAPSVRAWQRRSHERVRQLIDDRVAASGRRLRVPASDAAALLSAVTSGLALQRDADEAVPAERLLRTFLELLLEEEG